MGDFILIIKISWAHSGIALVPLPYSRHSHSRLLHTPLTSRFVTPPLSGHTLERLLLRNQSGKVYSCDWAVTLAGVVFPICLPLSTTDNSFPTASYSRGYRPSIKVISPPVCVSEPGYLLISRPEIVGQGGRAGSAGLTDGAWRGPIPAPPAPRPSSSGHGFRHRHRGGGGGGQKPGTAPFLGKATHFASPWFLQMKIPLYWQICFPLISLDQKKG